MVSLDRSAIGGLPVLTTFPLSAPSDTIVFGKNARPQPFTLLPLNEDQKFAVDRAKKYALEQSIQNALNKQAAQLHQQDLNTLKRNQALILLSRIYVGSISFEVGEDELRRTFGPFGPIKSVALSWDATLQKHKGFAFVEFEVPEAASLALEQMNGHTLAGRTLKVGRPSNAPQTGNLETELRSDENTRCRVYVASVHPELTEADMQTVFEAFGKVEECVLYPDPKCPGRHRGFGYIYFHSEEEAIAAVTSMNGFDLAGLQLRVCRAITPRGSPLPFEAAAAAKSGNSSSVTQASVSAVALAAASISAKVMSMSAEEAVSGTVVSDTTKSNNTGFSGPPLPVPNLPPPGVFVPTTLGTAPPDEQQQAAEEPGSVTTTSMWEDDDAAIPTFPSELPLPPVAAESSHETEENNEDTSAFLFEAPLSRVLLLENMVSAEEVDPDLEGEVAEECSNFGHVLRVFVHVKSDVRIFVHFDRSASAQAACESLNQRFFAGRVVHAKLYDEERFQLHEFDD
ncbi:hypothetical protein T265_11398 [Opisthorchis viverrini]|uniref:RRM domain-containing protein n=2 Tax=Opisthorchis viverrini TaxID=6198 RepID=A0A074YZ52_OPIVI|nr:hypothetical protein T265_11398 [Opisthorchis viverrini]KER19953.1 hypothetical protein T265_11398 [Opisthorchis viverrini]